MNNSIITLVLFLAMSVTACENKTTTINSKVQSQSKPKADEMYPGKPAAPVRLNYQFTDKAQASVPLSIDLMITPGVDADIISVNYTTSPQLVIGDNVPAFEFSNIPANQSVTQTIRVIPQNDGEHFIRLSVSIQSQKGRSGTRSFSIPVTAGTIEPKSSLQGNTKIEEQPEGERLLIQKGKETRTIDQ